jgi:branched-subunit amino acid ABC-type transport system permease component
MVRCDWKLDGQFDTLGRMGVFISWSGRTTQSSAAISPTCSLGMGSSIALKAFAASIIGGFGDVTGAIVGGLALGVVETFGAAYISVPYKDAFAFIVLVVFLLFRPQGLFGEKVAEKA